MSDPLLDKVRSRAQQHLAPSDADDAALNAIIADVETALVLARREGHARGWTDRDTRYGQPTGIDMAREAYPLPTRTRQVLREEPVPGLDRPAFIYRKQYDVLEQRRLSPLNEWHTADRINPDDFALMAHILDLHANPYRTEQVPGDETDPWGEGRPSGIIECGAQGCEEIAPNMATALGLGWGDFYGGVWGRCPAHMGPSHRLPRVGEVKWDGDQCTRWDGRHWTACTAETPDVGPVAGEVDADDPTGVLGAASLVLKNGVLRPEGDTTASFELLRRRVAAVLAPPADPNAEPFENVRSSPP